MQGLACLVFVFVLFCNDTATTEIYTLSRHDALLIYPATVANAATLTGRGAEFVGPDDGLLSCGYDGIGRLWPVDGIADRALELLGLAAAKD